MEILVLGGTAMLGRGIAATAVERGHTVTCLARGSADVPAGTSFVAADRDDGSGLKEVADRRWGAVIDVARQPGQVRRAVRDLSTSHRAFVSSRNVYADFSQLEDEDAPVREPLDGDVMADMSSYGEVKVACDKAVRGTTGSATIVRSGLIGGPGDWSGRNGYWPWRFAHPHGRGRDRARRSRVSMPHHRRAGSGGRDRRGVRAASPRHLQRHGPDHYS